MEDLYGNIVINEVGKINNELYKLLLLADPSKKVINDYLNRGIIFAVLILL